MASMEELVETEVAKMLDEYAEKTGTLTTSEKASMATATVTQLATDKEKEESAKKERLLYDESKRCSVFWGECDVAEFAVAEQWVCMACSETNDVWLSSLEIRVVCQSCGRQRNYMAECEAHYLSVCDVPFISKLEGGLESISDSLRGSPSKTGGTPASSPAPGTDGTSAMSLDEEKPSMEADSAKAQREEEEEQSAIAARARALLKDLEDSDFGKPNNKKGGSASVSSGPPRMWACPICTAHNPFPEKLLYAEYCKVCDNMARVEQMVENIVQIDEAALSTATVISKKAEDSSDSDADGTGDAATLVPGSIPHSVTDDPSIVGDALGSRAVGAVGSTAVAPSVAGSFGLELGALGVDLNGVGAIAEPSPLRIANEDDIPPTMIRDAGDGMIGVPTGSPGGIGVTEVPAVHSPHRIGGGIDPADGDDEREEFDTGGLGVDNMTVNFGRLGLDGLEEDPPIHRVYRCPFCRALDSCHVCHKHATEEQKAETEAYTEEAPLWS